MPWINPSQACGRQSLLSHQDSRILVEELISDVRQSYRRTRHTDLRTNFQARYDKQTPDYLRNGQQ